MTSRPCRTCGRSFEATGKTRYCSQACRCGTDAGYNAGCKCARCRAAHSRNHKRLRLRANPPVPAIGMTRRVQALASLGWSQAEISRRLGMTRTYLAKTMLRATIDQATHNAVARLYDELSMTWCTTITAPRTAAWARAQGWAPPLAYDEGAIDNPDVVPYGAAARTARAEAAFDVIVVERLLAGENVPSTRADKVEAMRRWLAAGRSQRSLCRIHGWAENRYVVRQDGAA